MPRLSKPLVWINLLLLCTIVVLTVSGGISPKITSAQSPTTSDKNLFPLSRNAMAVLGALNEWRISAGLWPLVLNDTLTEMAQDHADYLIGLSELPKGGDIHHDGQGRLPAERAFQSYEWPAYANNALWVAVGEVAYVGANERRAIEYWQGSDIHNRTVTNAGYREVGVGIVPHPYGNLYIVVLGSRPDTLPISLDPANNQLYFTQEAYRYAKGNTTLGDVTQLQFVNDETKISRDAWQSWTTTATWDPTVAAQLVIYSDGRNQIANPFVPTQNIVWTRPLLTSIEDGSLRLPTAPVPTVVEATPTTVVQDPALPTAFPTNTPYWFTDATAFPTNTLFPTNTPLPTRTPTPTITPTRPAGNPQVLMLYDTRSFTMINTTTGPLNLGGLVIESANGRLAATRWDTQFATASITALPAGGCVRAWSWNDNGTPALPTQCNYARSVLTLSPTTLFWTADFTVSSNGTVLANCSLAAGRCEVFVPNP